MNIEKIEINGHYVWVDKNAEIKEGDYLVILRHFEQGTPIHKSKVNGKVSVDDAKIIAASPELNLEGIPTYVEWLAKDYANNSAVTNYEEGINVGKYQGFIKGYQTRDKEIDTAKDFVPYEQALALKELGFNEPCFGEHRQWDGNPQWLQLYQDLDYRSTNPADYEYTTEAKAPTFSQAFRFFREKYNWQHSIDPTADQHRFELGYNYWIWNPVTGEEYHTMPKNRPTGDWEYETYEEAEIACIDKLIEIVKNKLP